MLIQPHLRDYLSDNRVLRYRLELALLRSEVYGHHEKFSMQLSALVALFPLGRSLFSTAEVSATTASVTTSDSDGSISSSDYSAGEEYAAQDAMQIGAMPPVTAHSTARQRIEKAHLSQRMSRKSEGWGTSHPRYRLLEALFGFTDYRERNMAELNRWRSLYKNVAKGQKQVLERVTHYSKKLDDIEELIYENESVCKTIVSIAMQYYGITQKELDKHILEAQKAGRQADKISVTQTLKHFVRDWAAEGAFERDEAFPCILSTLANLKSASDESKQLRVLLPGSGVGRLGHEIANLQGMIASTVHSYADVHKTTGFEVTINEWSMFMNVGYRFIESQLDPDSINIYPFVDGMSHHATTSDMTRSIALPDIAPNRDVLLVEGDFNTVLNDHEGGFDIIVTHYFIDTARNLMAYFDTIHRLLRPGGKWMNFGPLLYGSGPFVQLSLDEIIAVVEDMGFVFEDLSDECGALTFEGKKVRSKASQYGFNNKALTRHAYLAQVWIVRKS